MRRALSGLAVLMVLGAMGFMSCALLPRYRSVAPPTDAWPEDKLMESMNPWFLGEGFADRLVIEVDWVAGCKPGPHTIDGLRTTATKYAPPGLAVEVALDDEIPRAEWDATGTRADDRVDPLVERHADFAREPCDPEFRTTHFYVLFAPGTDKWFYGYSRAWFAEADGATPVQGIVVFHDAHARLAKLWLSCDRMEATTVVHELGHELGLVNNPAHERLAPYSDHCTSLKCLMALPTWRVYFRNAFAGAFNRFPTDYCDRCQEDIRRAQAAWRARLARDPGYRETRVAQLQAWYWSVSLRPVLDRGDYERVLAEVAKARRLYPDGAPLAYEEIRALTALGRFDEAALRLKQTEPDRRVRLSWTLGRALERAGRYEDAIALFDRESLRKADEYEFERSAFVLREAFESSGRLGEAISLVDEMLARGPAVSYFPEGTRCARADLLRRAGRLPEALAAAEKGLGSKKTRPSWFATAADIDDAIGRHEEATALLREWLTLEEKALARTEANAGPMNSKWQRSWTIALIHARLGEKERARAMTLQAGAPPEGTSYDSVLYAEIPVFARLEDWDRAAEALRKREKDSWYDVCGRREIAPMRRDPRYADLFRMCAASPGAK